MSISHLDRIESQSIHIIREAFRNLKPIGMLWSFGKDSTVMIWLARKAFFGHVPFPLIHCDTELEMDEVYAYRNKYRAEWKIDLLSEICPPLDLVDPTLPPDARIAARKTLALKRIIERERFQGIMVGIRRDEEGTRGKERFFSPRGADASWQMNDQPPEFWDHYMTDAPAGGHLRIHPLLHWTELDIWNYISRENIPVVPLYFARPYGQFGGKDFGGTMMRFRSLGEKGITFPLPSNAENIPAVIAELESTRVSERAGRPMGIETDESSFERLRADGYM